VSPCVPLLIHQRTVKLDFYRDLEMSRQNPSALTYGAVDSSASSGHAGLAGSVAVVAGFYPARSRALLLLAAAPLFAILAGIVFLGVVRGDQICRLCLCVTLAVAMGLFVLHIRATRYMLPAVPTLVLAIARVVQYWSTTARWRVTGLAVGAVVLCDYGAGYFRQALVPYGRPWENLVSVLQQNYQPGDTVVFVRLPPWLRQPDKTRFAVRCKSLDRQDDFIAF